MSAQQRRGRSAGALGLEWPVVVVAVLTAVAFGLRVVGMRQNLFADELFTFDDVHGRSLGGVIRQVRTGAEDNPPLFFLLAWAAAHLGDPTVWIRLPSLVLGTALVPLLYLLGVRTVGRWGGLVAAALVAFSGFSIYYANEARAYATLTFLVALSTLVLLRALEDGRRWWWGAYALCACAVLYTHYTGVFVLLAQAAWALWFHRDRIGALLLTHAAILAGYSPWLVTELSKNPSFTSLVPRLSWSYAATSLASVLPGNPLARPAEVPGSLWLAVFVGGLVAALVAACMRISVVGHRLADRPRPRVLLLALLALATPLGLLVFSFGGHDIFSPRNLSASLPAAALLIGWLLTSTRGAALALTAASVAAVGVGAAKTLDASYRGNDARSAARYIDRHARRGDPVVQQPPLFGAYTSPLGLGLSVYFKRHHDVSYSGKNDRVAWARVERGARAFVVSNAVFGFLAPPKQELGPGDCFRLRESRLFPSARLALGVYSLPRLLRLCAELALHGSAPSAGVRLQRRDGRYVIAPWYEHTITVARGAVGGFVDKVSASHTGLQIVGWAADLKRGRVAEWVLAFRDGHLIAAAIPAISRPDVAKARGPTLASSGFQLTLDEREARRAAPGQLRVLAVIGNRASLLARSAERAG